MTSIVGKVVHGKQIGRTINFPTANLNSKNHHLNIATVHCGYAYLKGYKYSMVLCVNWENTIEVHLLDYDGPEFYGEIMEINITHFIRTMECITNMECLKKVIENDVIHARKLLSP